MTHPLAEVMPTVPALPPLGSERDDERQCLMASYQVTVHLLFGVAALLGFETETQAGLFAAYVLKAKLAETVTIDALRMRIPMPNCWGNDPAAKQVYDLAKTALAREKNNE